MVSTAVVGFADGHGVVGEVDIAVVACRGDSLANVKVKSCVWTLARVSDVNKRLWLSLTD